MDLKIIKQLFPFDHLDDSKLAPLTDGLIFKISEYAKNDTILSYEKSQERIGFVLDGECAVYKAREKDDILLRNLKKTDSFGILTLFSQEEFPTLVKAKKSCRILFITKPDFLSLIHSDSQIAMNVISFLADKVSFLNKKIAMLSGATVEEKVENYLNVQYKAFGEQFAFNAAAVACQINIGRASLYRVLRKLEESGIIILDTKKITIMNKIYFERNSK